MLILTFQFVSKLILTEVVNVDFAATAGAIIENYVDETFEISEMEPIEIRLACEENSDVKNLKDSLDLHILQPQVVRRAHEKREHVGLFHLF